ncbi:holin [Corynebacterium diphtheriae]|nr:holin [Corynebacterium diphtheriae]OWN38208.1 holin [Corynebacterium diphtheriae bv. gravis]OEH71627.1 holin [Corynebacterium diphtheriae]OIR64598.1 holin [Corynebacterium diphtheriae]OIR64971.1 holin [Corynebacterium diphtheriae]
MMTVEFWKDLAERAIKTFAQALLAVLAVGVPIWELDWSGAFGIAATATVISVLTSIASISVGTQGTASAVSSPARHRKE